MAEMAHMNSTEQLRTVLALVKLCLSVVQLYYFYNFTLLFFVLKKKQRTNNAEQEIEPNKIRT
jgi:hypothetical protein